MKKWKAKWAWWTPRPMKQIIAIALSKWLPKKKNGGDY
jgi:hypothetical protein